MVEQKEWKQKRRKLRQNEKKIMKAFLDEHEKTINKLQLTNRNLIDILENSRGPGMSWSKDKSLKIMRSLLEQNKNKWTRKMRFSSMI